MPSHFRSLFGMVAFVSCVVTTASAQLQRDHQVAIALVAELPNTSFGAVVQRSPSGTVILLDRTSSIADLNAALHVVRAIVAKPPMKPDGFESFAISKSGPEAVRDPNKRKTLQSVIARLNVASRRIIERLGEVRAVDVSLEPTDRSSISH